MKKLAKHTFKYLRVPCMFVSKSCNWQLTSTHEAIMFFLCCHYVSYNNVFTIISNIFKELLGWKSKHTTSRIMQKQGMRTCRAINDCNPKHYGHFGPFIEGNNYPIQPLETLLTKSLNAMFHCFCSLNESRIQIWDFNAKRIHCLVLEYIHNERTDVSITKVFL